MEPICFRVTVHACRHLRAADRTGSSDPYVVLKIGRGRNAQRHATHVVNQNLNPVFDHCLFDFWIDPAMHEAILKISVWDKDRIGRDFLGALQLPLNDAEGKLKWPIALDQPIWLRLMHPDEPAPGDGTRGEIQLTFHLVPDAKSLHSVPSFQEIVQRVRVLSTATKSWQRLSESVRESESILAHLGPADEKDEKGEMEHVAELAEHQSVAVTLNELSLSHDSSNLRDGSSKKEATIIPERSSTPSTPPNDPDAVIGLLRLDIVAAHNLPRERSVLLPLTYDSDPFVVISFGQQSYRTRVVRHSLNPVWRETVQFPVRAGEQRYAVSFAVYDEEQLAFNEHIGRTSLQCAQILADTAAASSTASVAANSDSAWTASCVTYRLPLQLPNRVKPNETANVKPSQDSQQSTLTVTAAFRSYHALRLDFWRALARQYDPDQTGGLSAPALCAMLDALGSTVSDATLAALFPKAFSEVNYSVSIEDIVHVLESFTVRGGAGGGGGQLVTLRACPVCQKPWRQGRQQQTKDTFQSTQTLDEWDDVDLTEETSGMDTPPRAPSPLPKLKGPTQADKHSEDISLITHLAVCTSTAPSAQVERYVRGGFLTEEQASRKWFSKLASYFSFGRYNLGQQNGNIFVHDRDTGQLTEERMPTYVRLGIRMVYHTRASQRAVDRIGRQMLQSMTIKQGKRFDAPESRRHILPFMKFYNIDASELAQLPETFETFNAFFARKLKPGARALRLGHREVDDAQKHYVAAPCDARYGSSLLDDTQEAARYSPDCTVMVCRLAPQDYHRFATPVSGIWRTGKRITGTYFTVNPMAVRLSTLDVFTENVRLTGYIDSDHYGRVAVVAIGAMMVGSIVLTVGGLEDRTGQTTLPGDPSRKVCDAVDGTRIERLDELGFFCFGGSTVVFVFESGKLVFEPDLLATSRKQIETFMKMGDVVGCVKS